jgi:hypothetical protein
MGCYHQDERDAACARGCLLMLLLAAMAVASVVIAAFA